MFRLKRKYDLKIYGHAQTPFSFMFYEEDDANIIEDGLLNYSQDILETHKINPIIDKLLHFVGIYFLNQKEALGSHQNIKKVFLTNKHNNPLIKDKVEILDIRRLWDKKSDSEKEEVLKIFNINKEVLSEFDENCVLLLTQPLSEDKFNEITYENELKIYQNIINKFSSKKTIIKPHPRETKDYSKLFPNCVVIDKYFPIELLLLLGVNPKTVVGITSTAVFNFSNSRIFIYDGELYSDKLKELRNNLYKILKSW